MENGHFDSFAQNIRWVDMLEILNSSRFKSSNDECEKN